MKNHLYKLFVLVCLVILVLLAIGFGKNFLKKQRINKEVETLQQEISDLERGNKELSSMIDYLQTTSFIEAEARNKFGLAKEGERVLVISDTDKQGLNTQNKQKSQAENKVSFSNPKLWFYYFWGGMTE